MSDTKSNKTIILLTGIIFGLIISLIVVILFNNRNDQMKESSSSEYSYQNEKSEKDDNQEINSEAIEQEDFDPVEYFQEINDSKNENVLKEGFVKLIDFLFYDEPIKGVRFSELKDSAKLKLLGVLLSIDKKIDEYFPGYKETISNGSKKIYNNVKLKVVELYIDITSKICSENEQLCIDAKNDFNSLRESFGITFDYLKDIGNDGLNKLKDWYEDFRN